MQFSPFRFILILIIFLSIVLYIVSCNPNENIDNEVNEEQSSEEEVNTERDWHVYGHFLLDYENKENLPGLETLTDSIAHSGKFSIQTDTLHPFSIGLEKTAEEAIENEAIKNVGINVWLYPFSSVFEAQLALSIEDSSGKSIIWHDKSFKNHSLPVNTWTKVNANFNFPAVKKNSSYKFKIFVWNRGRTPVLVDDLEVTFGENERLEIAGREQLKTLQPSFLIKENISNANSVFLINKEEDSEIWPEDQVIAGNFLNPQDGLDEIAVLRKNKPLFFYSYKFNKKSFSKAGEQAYRAFMDFPVKIAADFSGDDADEILFIDPASKIVVIASAPDWKPVETGLAGLKISEKTRFLAADLSGDVKAVLLIFDEEKNQCLLVEFKEKNPKILARFNAAELGIGIKNTTFVKGKFSDETDKDILLAFNFKTENGKLNNAKLLEYNPQTKKIIQSDTGINKTSGLKFSKEDEYFTGYFSNHKKQSLVKYNKHWRFELKEHVLEKNSLSLPVNIDFKGFDDDKNPKYYEMLKIFPGNFMAKDKTSFLVIMRNCTDKNFDGKNCSSYSNLPYLPNSLQLYSAERQP